MIYPDYEPPKEDYFTQIYYNVSDENIENYKNVDYYGNGKFFTHIYKDVVDENGFMLKYEPYNIYMENFDYTLNLPSYPRSDIEVDAAMRLITCTCDHDADGNSLPFFEALDDPDCFLSYFLDSNNDGNLDWTEIRRIL